MHIYYVQQSNQCKKISAKITHLVLRNYVVINYIVSDKTIITILLVQIISFTEHSKN